MFAVFCGVLGFLAKMANISVALRDSADDNFTSDSGTRELADAVRCFGIVLRTLIRRAERVEFPRVTSNAGRRLSPRNQQPAQQRRGV